MHIAISSVPKDTGNLDESGCEFLTPTPEAYASLVKKGRKQAAVHGFKLVCGAERLSGDYDLGGNGEVFERSEGIFFFFLYVLKNE